MTSNYITAKIRRNELQTEKLINKFRFAISLFYMLMTSLFAALKSGGDGGVFTAFSLIPNSLLFLFSVFLFIYLRDRKSVNNLFKYICVIMDITIISAGVYIGCSFPKLDPPIPYLSIWALFYGLFIILGAFRYSARCANFSGIYSGACYLTVILLKAGSFDFPYYFTLDDKTVTVSFPVFYEFFRVIAMVVTGVITGIACKRNLHLFSVMTETQSAASKAASKTMEQTSDMANTIRKSTDEILHSSNQTLLTANNQAASIHEIEATINEGTQIAAEIADKTSNVASIASKTKTDAVHGFGVLKQNVGQMEEIKDKNDSVISGIISLSDKIIKIRDIIETIDSITDQTKVIAFNASLEAASAKEFGARFSIVSSEVNRLADDIAELTKEIRKQADDMQASSASLIISGKESVKKINEGNNLIKELENIFYEIKAGAQETSEQAQIITVSTQKQRRSSEQINIAIVDISKGLSSFIQSTKAASFCAQELTKMISELDALLAKKKGFGA